MLNAHQQMGATIYLPVWLDRPEGFIFVAGGTGDSGDVELQPSPLPRPIPPGPPLPPWTTAAPLLTPRFGHALCVGQASEVALIFAIGGRSNPAGALLSGVEGYNPAPKMECHGADADGTGTRGSLTV